MASGFISEEFLGKSSTWCPNPVRCNEMKDVENLWLQHQAEFLPNLALTWPCTCSEQNTVNVKLNTPKAPGCVVMFF